MSKLQPETEPAPRPRILFFAEGLSLAHVSRPLALAEALDPEAYDVIFACDPRYERFLAHLRCTRVAVHSATLPAGFVTAPWKTPIFDPDTLRGQVQEDLRLMAQYAPDLVIGDARASLAISAQLAKVPFAAITNAYGSPYAEEMIKLITSNETGIASSKGAQWLLRVPAWLCECLFLFGSSVHMGPINKVRKEYGLPSLGRDSRRMVTEADYTLYPDIPELVPTVNLPSHHYYLGPVLWSPRIPLPDWWERLPADKPVIYVNLGSTGQHNLMPMLMNVLRELPVTAMVATVERTQLDNVPGNIFISDYIPGVEAAARSQLVICNGGSGSTQQAASAGTPILGIVSHAEQYVNMATLCRYGAGKILLADWTRPQDIRTWIMRILEQTRYAQAARGLADIFANYDAPSRFRGFVQEVINKKASRVL